MNGVSLIIKVLILLLGLERFPESPEAPEELEIDHLSKKGISNIGYRCQVVIE